MPFNDVVNVHNAGPAKRTHDESEDAHPGPSKRARHAQADSPERDQAASGSHAAADPYSTLPAPCTAFVQVRLQLCRFKGVYRVARLPLSCTFAHLYRFALFAFGWSGQHAHEWDVCTNAVLYSANWRRGEIKAHGVAPPPEPDRDADLDSWFEWVTIWGRGEEHPALRVVECGRRGRIRDYGFDLYTAPVKEDNEVTLGDVWSASRKRRENASKGECSNRQIGIKLRYDLGSSWDVHVTIEANKKDNGYMFYYDPPRNVPIVITAKGAPPVEDAHHDLPGELDGKHKKVSPLIFDPSSFEKYIAGELGSETRKTELAIFNYEGEYARRQEARKARKARRQQLQREFEATQRLARSKRNNEDLEDDGEEDNSSEHTEALDNDLDSRGHEAEDEDEEGEGEDEEE